jgi:N-dimethylarginine dimethylaminohydrolase
MYEGYSNIFSINSNTIVSDKTFVRLNNKLSNLGFKVEEVYYREVSKFGGLFRCSTLPLYRK